MELHELKNVWNQYDQKIDQQIKIDFQLFKKINLDKTQSLLSHLRWGAIVELIINYAFLDPLVRFSIRHISEPKFVLPAFLLAFLILLSMAWNVYTLIFLSTINYLRPIATIQKKLAAFNFWNLFRQRKLLYIIIPLSWASMLILFCKGFLGIDLYNHLTMLLINLFASLAIVPPLIWFMNKFPDKKMDEALDFLTGIKKFEQED